MVSMLIGQREFELVTMMKKHSLTHPLQPMGFAAVLEPIVATAAVPTNF